MGIKTTETKSKLALLIIVTMLLGVLSPAMAADTDRAVGFTDVENHWAKDTIIKWIEEGLIEGYEDGKFKPNNNISRAEFMAVINRALDFNEEATIEFSDVGPDDWFYADVAKAVKAGYIEGYEDGSARPAQDISRQEAVVALSRALGIDGREQGNQFTDGADIADWSLPYINALTEKGYIGGYSDGSFQAQRSISRAEAVTMLDKARADIEEDIGGEESEPEEDDEDDEAPDSGGGSSSSGNGGGSGSVKVSAISATGDAVAGSILTAKTTPTKVTGNYQWFRADEEGEYAKIDGATAKTYTLTNEDVGSYIKVTIEGTGSYKGTATSDPSEKVEKPALSIYKLSYEDLADSYVVGALVDVDGKEQSNINTAVETAIDGLEPVKVTLATDIIGKAGYDAIRFAPVEAGDNIQLWAKDTKANWYDINVAGWGDEEGFILPAEYNVETPLYILSNEVGTYDLNVKLVNVEDDDAVLAEVSGTVTVRVPEHSDYGFEIDEGVEIVAVNNLPEGSSIPVDAAETGDPGDLPEEAKTALKNAFNGEGINLDAALVNVTFKALEPFKELDYEKVRILPLEVNSPEGGTLQAWMYAAVQDKAWFDLVKTGWGSKGKGFSQQADEASTMQAYVFADTPGIYEITFNAVDTSKVDEPVIATGTAEVIVKAGGINVSKLDQVYYAAGETLEFTISGFSSGEEVKVGMHIFTGGPGYPWASDKPVLSGMDEVNGDLFWVGTAEENGKLTVKGTVQSGLPSGELRIALPDYGYYRENGFQLQDNQGFGVRVGEQ